MDDYQFSRTLSEHEWEGYLDLLAKGERGPAWFNLMKTLKTIHGRLEDVRSRLEEAELEIDALEEINRRIVLVGWSEEVCSGGRSTDEQQEAQLGDTCLATEEDQRGGEERDGDGDLSRSLY